ncbi:hypothetical protein [Algoriphagus terrigena]|uniref:hypothetical protein n=1 Tax=Algoriphagus terrigena TaxID=344884 RepID=UPI0004009304|nr:hypothetical protein [Algoriphagus terrigena]
MTIKENIEQLQERLKYSGFGESLNKDLEKSVKAKKDEFSLEVLKEVGSQQLEYKLHFQRSSEGRYYYNGFDAKLANTDGGEVSQRFYQNQGISAKEAYNLLEGRAVFKSLFNKEGQRYNAWLQLDLGNRDDKGQHPVTQYHQNYGFNLEESLDKFAIVGRQAPENKETLLYSLKKGNLHQLGLEGQGEKYFLAANPKFKSVSVFDEHGKALKIETIDKRLNSNEELGENSAKRQQKRINA